MDALGQAGSDYRWKIYRHGFSGEMAALPLDELLAGYQRGAALLALCKDKLSAVEEQIKLLETSPQGALVTKPWEEGEA